MRQINNKPNSHSFVNSQSGAALRRQWRRTRMRELERETQLDFFVDRIQEADAALEKLNVLRRDIERRRG